MEECRKSRHGPQSAINSAERQYRDRGESNYRGSLTRSHVVWNKNQQRLKKDLQAALRWRPYLHACLGHFCLTSLSGLEILHCSSREDACRSLTGDKTIHYGFPGHVLKVFGGVHQHLIGKIRHGPSLQVDTAPSTNAIIKVPAQQPSTVCQQRC